MKLLIISPYIIPTLPDQIIKNHSSAFDNNDFLKSKKHDHILPKLNSVPVRPFI